MKIETTCYDLAQRYVGLEETPGAVSNPAILAMLRLDNEWPKDDEVAWCSAFVNWIAWHLRLPRSKALNARSWLAVGTPIALTAAEPENDVVIFKRGVDQPGPEVLLAPGHVGFFARAEDERVWVLGGNQQNAVCLAPFNRSDVLGTRRLF